MLANDCHQAARSVYKMKKDYLYAMENQGFSHPQAEKEV